MTPRDFLNLLTLGLLATATGICLKATPSGEKSVKPLPVLAVLLVAAYASPRFLAPWIAALALIFSLTGLPRLGRG
jgi:hypothetical protein